jgi:hypothetical protein
MSIALVASTHRMIEASASKTEILSSCDGFKINVTATTPSIVQLRPARGACRHWRRGCPSGAGHSRSATHLAERA